MDRVLVLENQLRSLSHVPGSWLPKDPEYTIYNDFMDQRDKIVEKNNAKSNVK